MSYIKTLFRTLTAGSKAWGYAKMAEKTGMTIAEIELLKTANATAINHYINKASIFLKSCRKKAPQSVSGQVAPVYVKAN